MNYDSFKLNILVAGASLLILNACGSTSSSNNSYDTSSAEVASESVAGAAGASDNGGSVVTLNTSPKLEKDSKLMVAQLIDQLFESKASAASCSTAAAVQGGTCGGTGSAVMTLAMGSCSGLLGTWTGNYTLTFNSGAACSAASSGGLMSMGANNSVIITTTNAGLSVGNYTVSMSSSSSGFSIPESGGIQVTCGSTSCSASRAVSILGINRILMNGSNTLYNHTINTPTAFTITGVGAAKQISGGQLQLQHNLAHFIATSTVSQTLSFSSGCCLPTGGSIATAFSNGKSGAEIITFGPTCGSASVNGSSVSLNYCM